MEELRKIQNNSNEQFMKGVAARWQRKVHLIHVNQ